MIAQGYQFTPIMQAIISIWGIYIARPQYSGRAYHAHLRSR